MTPVDFLSYFIYAAVIVFVYLAFLGPDCR